MGDRTTFTERKRVLGLLSADARALLLSLYEPGVRARGLGEMCVSLEPTLPGVPVEPNGPTSAPFFRGSRTTPRLIDEDRALAERMKAYARSLRPTKMAQRYGEGGAVLPELVERPEWAAVIQRVRAALAELLTHDVVLQLEVRSGPERWTLSDKGRDVAFYLRDERRDDD
jgi:hypothetical protein